MGTGRASGGDLTLFTLQKDLMRKPFLVVAFFILAAVTSVQAASWHYGNWGADSGTCFVGWGNSWANGQTTLCGGDACAHIVTGHGVRNIQSRGKAFNIDSYGYGPWVGQGLQSHHDCGAFSCTFRACRTRVFQ
jgi:hypothetical protein